jgi:hypothetical protein
MRTRIPAAVVLVVAMLASVAALSGCASRAGSNSSAAAGGKTTASSRPSPSAPAMGGGGGAPNIQVVRLGTSFSPKTLQLGAGQKFLVVVSGADKATGSGISGACTPAAAARFSTGLLSLSCQGSSYLYTTRHAGSGELSVTVRPNCTAGTVCPQWVAAATLKLTIS